MRVKYQGWRNKRYVNNLGILKGTNYSENPTSATLN
jgi:hypothetical protein